MVIMIVFLVLTFILVIITAIYLSHKKKSTNNIVMKKSDKEIRNVSNKRNKKRLADILKIKIKDKMIYLGNRYSYIVRLGNIDFNMLSDKEQNMIESILIQTSFAIDYPIQFFSTTEYIDTSSVTDFMKENKTSNSNVQEYKEYLIRYLENLMENKTIAVVNNYAVISYDGFYENAEQELERKAISLKNNLLKAGIICEILNEDEICDLIYRELNKNASFGISKLREGGKKLYVGKTKKEKTNRYI